MNPDRAWVRLGSGKRLDLIAPQPDQWEDLDLAVGLSRTYRWGGHSRWDLPMSVAQHSLLVLVLRQQMQPHRRLTPREALREVIHDGEEALAGGLDFLTPVKPYLGPEFHALTARLRAAIAIRYALPDGDARFHDHDRSVPPYPAVLLGEWFVGEVSIFGWDTTDDPHHRKDGECSSGEGMLCHYKAELRLCIVPVGPDMHPEPALRVKVGLWIPRAAIEDEEGTTHTLAFEGLDWIPSSEPGPIRARASSNGYLMNCRLWNDGHAVRPLISQYFPQGRGSHTCQFLPLTGRVAEDWFGLPAYDFELQSWHYSTVPIHIRAVGAPLFRNICADDFSPFKADTIAAGLDHILSGHHDHDLLTLLDTHAEQLIRLLEDASATARVQREKAMADLDSRLRRMRGEAP